MLVLGDCACLTQRATDSGVGAGEGRGQAAQLAKHTEGPHGNAHMYTPSLATCRAHLDFNRLYIAWLVGAVFYHLPSLEAMGVPVKADVSLAIVVFTSTLAVGAARPWLGLASAVKGGCVTDGGSIKADVFLAVRTQPQQPLTNCGAMEGGQVTGGVLRPDNNHEHMTYAAGAGISVGCARWGCEGWAAACASHLTHPWSVNKLPSFICWMPPWRALSCVHADTVSVSSVMWACFPAFILLSSKVCSQLAYVQQPYPAHTQASGRAGAGGRWWCCCSTQPT